MKRPVLPLQYLQNRSCTVFTLSLQSLRLFLRLFLFFVCHPSRTPSHICCFNSLGNRETGFRSVSFEVRTYEYLLFLPGCMSAASYSVWRVFDGPQCNINKPLIPWRSPCDLCSTFKTGHVPSSFSHYKAYDFSFDFLLFFVCHPSRTPSHICCFTPWENEKLGFDMFPLRYVQKNL
jgi:hypothetical protein